MCIKFLSLGSGDSGMLGRGMGCFGEKLGMERVVVGVWLMVRMGGLWLLGIIVCMCK